MKACFGEQLATTAALALGLWLTPACSESHAAPLDDAQGRQVSDFPELADDVFKPMDGGIDLSPEEVKGRNTWNLWCGGNEQFWDRMSRESFGLVDLLKTLDSRKRSQRFKDLGLINQPGYREATKPDQHGLWLDEAEQPEPSSIDPKVYGRSSGVMGFRIFDNPDFTGDAIKRWDAKRYNDPNDLDYAADPNLIRPYRVGVSCGACHIAFNPCHPPADPVNPKWDDLASAIGNQYIREGPVFAPLVRKGGLFWEMFQTQPPGTSDTSRIATDHINNPNAINPLFELGARLALRTAEQVSGEAVGIPDPTTNDVVEASTSPKRVSRKVPHVLKDGADSVGIGGATLRVYVNIGMYSQHWLQQHQALIGLQEQKPFSIEAAQKNSVYWRATETKFMNVMKFFERLKSFRLGDAKPDGAEHITKDAAQMERGKLVFAENCAECHSSKRPPAGADAKAFYRKSVLEPDFLDNNFLSDDQPHPISKLGTNAARACATNAMEGHVWANFSSDTYKSRSSVGAIQVWNPYTNANESWKVPAGGAGYYRTPSLVCLWSSAPFFHNNGLGTANGDPSVAGRLAVFDDAVHKLLWPQDRLGEKSIWRTTQECSLQLQASVLPKPLRLLFRDFIEKVDGTEYFRLGPVPAGTPVNLLANLDPDTKPADLLKLCLKIKAVLAKIHLEKLDAAAAKNLMRDELAPSLLAANKCPDLVEDRGHEFGAQLPDEDKFALIEFLKTF